jgi:hypothetical protein
VTVGEIAQLITSIATLIGVLRVTSKVNKVERSTDGIVEKLVNTTRIEAHAAGVKEEKERL